MLQQLATETGAQPWVIASMIFFLSVFLIAAFRVWRTSAADAEGFARLPLGEDGAPTPFLGVAEGQATAYDRGATSEHQADNSPNNPDMS